MLQIFRKRQAPPMIDISTSLTMRLNLQEELTKFALTNNTEQRQRACKEMEKELLKEKEEKQLLKLEVNCLKSENNHTVTLYESLLKICVRRETTYRNEGEFLVRSRNELEEQISSLIKTNNNLLQELNYLKSELVISMNQCTALVRNLTDTNEGEEVKYSVNRLNDSENDVNMLNSTTLAVILL
jgi:hypothetical protein